MDDAADRTLVARRARTVAVAATALLIVLGAAWELWLAPTGSGTLAVKVLPLFFALPGLVRMRLYTYRWLSLAIWLYAAEGAVRATGDRGVSASLAIAELVLALVLFAACCVHVRARLRGGAPAGVRP
jgi:uncharacterized membrane protein